jgi:hypothetical protein
VTSIASEGSNAPTTDDAWLLQGRRKSGLGSRLRHIPHLVREGGLDLRNTWQVVAGAILLPLGVAVILLGWSGAAHGRVEQQQIPYLISGGLLGLALVVIGGFFFWAHWLYRIYDQADLQHQQFMRSQAEIRDALLGMAGGDHNRNGSVPGAAGSPASRSQVGSRYVATASGSNFHRPDCPIVARRPNGLHEVSGREAEDLQPCRICEPLAGQA